MSRNKVKKSLKLLLSNKVDKQRLIPATLGAKIKGKEKVKVPNRDQYVYVRIHGRDSEIAQAFNDKTNYVYGLPVLLKKEGNRYIVTGRDTLRYPEWLEGKSSIAPHGMQHSYFGGTDITWIHKKQFTPFGVSPLSGTSVRIHEDWFLLDENYYHFTGTVLDLAGAYPAVTNQALFLSLYFDTNSHLIQGITGSVFDTSPFPSTLDPYVPSMHVSAGIPLASILLTSTNKAVTWNSIYDIRPFFTGKSSSYSTAGKLFMYDNGVFKVTGTAIDFEDGLSVEATGTIAFVNVYSNIYKNSSLIGQRNKINFIEGGGIGIGVVDNPANNQVNVTLSFTGTSTGGNIPHYIVDIQGALTTGSSVATFIVTDKHDIEYVYAHCNTLGVTGTTIIDVNKNGSTIFTTQANRPSLAYNDADKFDRKTPDITSLDEYDVLTLDIDSVAQGARDLQVVIKGFGLSSSSYSKMGLITPTPPNLDEFTWVNQGSGTAIAFTGGIYLYAQALASDQLRILKKSAPSPPYSIIMGAYPFVHAQNYNKVGLCVYDSSTQKVIVFFTCDGVANKLLLQKYTNPSTFSSTVTSTVLGSLPNPLFLKMTDNNTNLTFYWGCDGVNWIQFYSESRTAFLTPNSIGFFANSDNATYPAAITVFHWKVE